MDILIFSSYKHPFAPRLNDIATGNRYYESHYRDLIFNLPDQGNNNISILVNGRDIRSFDYVFFRHAEKFVNYAVTIANYLKANKIGFNDSYLENQSNGAKMLQMMLLQLNNIPTPKTLVIANDILGDKYDYLKAGLGENFIMKENNASHGQLNYLIKSPEDFKEAVAAIKDPSMLYICQEFIPNSFDYRLVTIGGKVKVIKKRIRTSNNSHLNNVFQGAKIEIVPKDGLEKIIDLAEKAAKLYKTEVAGVDIIVSEADSLPYILEVNRAPDISDPESLAAIEEYLSFQASPDQVNILKSL